MNREPNTITHIWGGDEEEEEEEKNYDNENPLFFTFHPICPAWFQFKYTTRTFVIINMSGFHRCLVKLWFQINTHIIFLAPPSLPIQQ